MALNQSLLFMKNKLFCLLPILLLVLSSAAQAQTNHPFTQAFTTALSRGDAGGLSLLLGDEVELQQPGATGTFRKQVVAGKLADFLRQNPPAKFMVRHQGASADGQMYAIGQLTTQAGGNYKVLLRAKPEGNQYRIVKLDFLKNL